MNKYEKMFCPDSLCDYDTYYKKQAGGGLDIKYYKVYPRQRGFGFLSSIISRYAYPALKFLGEQALNTGTNIISDVIPGLKVAKKNLKRRAVKTLKDISEKLEQSGVGMPLKIKRRRTSIHPTQVLNRIKFKPRSKLIKRRAKSRKRRIHIVKGGGRRRPKRIIRKKRRITRKKPLKRKVKRRNLKKFDIFS